MQTWNVALFILGLSFCDVKTSNVDGMWNGKKHEFLDKFAVTTGNHIYMYGNFTANHAKSTATLVFAPADTWKHLYKNVKRRKHYDDNTCTSVMAPLCSKTDATEERYVYIRKVPCGDVCDSQPDNITPVPHSQVTYKIENVSTQFYYAILVPCLPAKGCNWIYPGERFANIIYDVWFVSGDPFVSDHDIFTYQFSFDEHGVLVVLIIVVILYGILLPFHLIGYTWLLGNCGMPNFVRVFTVAMLIDCTGLIFVIVHTIIFAHDGQGIIVFYDLGFFLEVLADCVLLLIVLLIAKGYRITISIIRRKRLLSIIWLMYFFSVITFSVWTLVSVLCIKPCVLELFCMTIVWYNSRKVSNLVLAQTSNKDG